MKKTNTQAIASKSELQELQELSQRLDEIADMNISAVISIMYGKLCNFKRFTKPQIEYKLDMVSDRQTDLIRAVNYHTLKGVGFMFHRLSLLPNASTCFCLTSDSVPEPDYKVFVLV